MFSSLAQSDNLGFPMYHGVCSTKGASPPLVGSGRTKETGASRLEASPSSKEGPEHILVPFLQCASASIKAWELLQEMFKDP